MSIINRMTKYCKSGRIVDRITVERNGHGHWFYRRRNIGGVNLVSNVNWNSCVEATEAAARVVASDKGKSKLYLPGHLKATMLAKWKIEGIQAWRMDILVSPAMTEDGELQETDIWHLQWVDDTWAVAYEPRPEGTRGGIIHESECFAHAGDYDGMYAECQELDDIGRSESFQPYLY